MRKLSTSEAAKMLKIDRANLQRAIRQGKVSPPRLVTVGGITFRLWTHKDVERVRKQLPKIKDGRRKRKKRRALCARVRIGFSS